MKESNETWPSTDSPLHFDRYTTSYIHTPTKINKKISKIYMVKGHK